MIHILTPEQMRAADSAAINNLGVPGAILMENAALSAAGIILGNFMPEKPTRPLVIMLCGSGNNGGDGFALARHLIGHADVFVFLIGRLESMSPETRTNFEVLKKCISTIIHIEDESQIDKIDFDCDIIIDSLIGVGGSENLRGIVVPLLQKAGDSHAIKIAIDAPTGLNTETGNAHPDSFKADYTITMLAPKTGMLLNDGINLCGEIYTAYLGVPGSIANPFSNTFSLEFNDLRELLPKRDKVSSKFDYGKVLIVASSRKYPGAGALAANAAITGGAGLVKLFTTRVHHSLKPEVIPFELIPTEDGSIAESNLETILLECEKSDVLAIGPGLGENPETINLVRKILEKSSKELPIIIDADGLRAIDNKSKLRKNIIITPHTGELSRITQIPRDETGKNSLVIAKEWAKKLKCIVVLKHVPTAIAEAESAFLNLNGNPGMATGGSGDVLTGLIAALTAQKTAPYLSAALGVFLHAAAGDYYAEQYSMETLTASDIIDSLKYVIHKVYSE